MDNCSNTEKTWWQGNSTRIWRIGLIAYMGTLSFLGAWIFNRTAELPDKFVNKTEFRTVVDRIENKMDKIYEKLME